MVDLKRMYTATAVVLLNCVLAVVCLDLLIGASIKVKHALEGRSRAEGAEVVLPPPFDHVKDRERFLDRRKAESVVFEPFRHWRDAQFENSYYHSDENGVRVTVKSSAPIPGAKKVFMFGGSTLKGPNIGDEMTIPSRLQARLGSGYDVYNYAQNGYNSTQQVIYLMELLAKGQVPDIVILYGGLCDVIMGNRMGNEPRGPVLLTGRFIDMERERDMIGKSPALYGFRKLYEESNIAYMVTWLRIKLGLLVTDPRKQAAMLNRAKTEKDVQAWVDSALHYFEENVKVVKALGAYHGFETYVFWEPALQEESRTAMDYEKAFMVTKSDIQKRVHRVTYPRAKKAFSGRDAEHVFFFGDLFRDAGFPVFVDVSHLGPQACDLVAEKIYDIIERDGAARP